MLYDGALLHISSPRFNDIMLVPWNWTWWGVYSMEINKFHNPGVFLWGMLVNVYQHATGEKRCSGGRIHRIRQFHRRRPEKERRRCGVRDSALRRTPGSAGGLDAHAQYGMRHSGKDRLTRNACLRRQVCFRVWERRRERYRDNDTHGTPMFSLWVLRLITWFPQP